MAVELEALVDEISVTAASPSPLDRLAAAVVLHHRLTDIGEQVLDRFIADARSTGSSWAQIGAVLGVSKQAAQQRHGSPRAASEPPVGGPFARFTPRARRAVALAQEAARRLGHNCIATEHLLIGVAASGGIAQHVLHDLACDAPTIERAIAAASGRQTRQAGPTGLAQSPSRRGRRGLPLTPLATQVVDAALAEAGGFGHDRVDTEHVLLGLFAVRTGVATELLPELGIAETDVRQRVIERLRKVEPGAYR